MDFGLKSSGSVPWVIACFMTGFSRFPLYSHSRNEMNVNRSCLSIQKLYHIPINQCLNMMKINNSRTDWIYPFYLLQKCRNIVKILDSINFSNQVHNFLNEVSKGLSRFN